MDGHLVISTKIKIELRDLKINIKFSDATGAQDWYNVRQSNVRMRLGCVIILVFSK